MNYTRVFRRRLQATPCHPFGLFVSGVWYASTQSGVEKAAYFYGYGWLKALALQGGGRGELSTATDLGLGYLAEAFHLPFTIPIEVLERARALAFNNVLRSN